MVVTSNLDVALASATFDALSEELRIACYESTLEFHLVVASITLDMGSLLLHIVGVTQSMCWALRAEL